MPSFTWDVVDSWLNVSIISSKSPPLANSLGGASQQCQNSKLIYVGFVYVVLQ
jgi:hypothetical protein